MIMILGNRRALRQLALSFFLGLHRVTPPCAKRWCPDSNRVVASVPLCVKHILILHTGSCFCSTCDVERGLLRFPTTEIDGRRSCRFTSESTSQESVDAG